MDRIFYRHSSAFDDFIHERTPSKFLFEISFNLNKPFHKVKTSNVDQIQTDLPNSYTSFTKGLDFSSHYAISGIYKLSTPM